MQATKRINAWKYYRANTYQGYNHVLNIAQPDNESPASQLMTISRDGTSQLLNVQPAKRLNESISQNHPEELLQHIVLGAYDPSNVQDDASQDENRNPYVQYPGVQIPRYRRSFLVPIFRRLLPHHAT